MRWTRFFIPTTKETPHDAAVPSHVLMIRAGMLRQVAAGSYAYLPLGYRSLQKVTAIIREEMNAAGAIELHMPAMQPVELWQESGRVEAMGSTLVHLPDKAFRKGTVLGPTHEEVITDIARAYVHSYKQLPINFYQIQTKFRDEPRPKSGVLRTREFLMKDAYSFDTDLAGLDVAYDKMYRAYCRVFTRCGLPFRAVEAESGPIGGDASHEFMVVTDAGEDYMVRSEDGKYAANVERAAVAPLPDSGCAGLDPLAEVHTPGRSTIDDVSRLLKCEPARMIKSIVYQHADGILMALVRGDHEVNEAKLRRVAGVKGLAPATPEQIEKTTGAKVGFAGPVKLNARVIVDQAVTVMHNAVTGANKTDYHLTGVNAGRDFVITESGDIRTAVAGDRSVDGSPLAFDKCIEIGHVFKLGTKYSDAMHAHYLDTNGKSAPFIMGCYGMGLNRIMAAAIEAFHDENGIIWPVTIAPFSVHICALDVRDEAVMGCAARLHDELEAAGVDVLLDDRDERPGVKFKDADLIGNPIRVTVGKRALADGVVEIGLRRDGEVQKIPADRAAARVRELVVELMPQAPAST
ncbi:MAG: proline--tRNA ligase [Phycisphaerales bacterium]|nr:proline--tRNA ligase [Phycisphaerales bacterium]